MAKRRSSSKEYLEMNTDDFLSYGLDDEDEEEGEEEEDVEEEAPEDEMDEETSGDDDDDETISDVTSKPVTLQLIQKWKSSLESNEISVLKDVAKAVAACVATLTGNKNVQPYTVKGTQEFNSLIKICLQHVPNMLDKRIPQKSKKALPSSDSQWNRVRSSIKLHLCNLLELVQHLTDRSMIVLLLKQVQHLARFLVCYPKLLKSASKALVKLWSTSTSEVSIVSFVTLRHFAAATSATFLTTLVKSMYLAFVANSKFTSPRTHSHITLMKNSLVEIFGLDHSTTYQHGFVYIRQLAIQLRTATTSHKKESYQTVYNWQFIHCIHLWCRVLAECQSDTLKPLIFPLVQVTTGVMRLAPSSRYFPLRLHCISSLNSLASQTGTLIPVASPLVDILGSADMQKKPKPSTAKPINFDYILKVTKAQLQTKAFQDAVLEKCLDGLLNYFTIHSHSIAFPELVLPIATRLRKLCKETKQINVKQEIKQLVDKLEETSAEVTSTRSAVGFGPADSDTIERWEAARKLKTTAVESMYEKRKTKAAKRERIQEISEISKITKKRPKTKETKKKAAKKAKLDDAVVVEADDTVEDFTNWSDSDDDVDDALAS